jgi:ActR/RegA family two-component response regulator
VIFSQGPLLGFESLGQAPPSAALSWRNPVWRVPDEGFTIDSVITDLVSEVLRETGNNISATARRLGVTREFLRYRLNGQKNRE